MKNGINVLENTPDFIQSEFCETDDVTIERMQTVEEVVSCQAFDARVAVRDLKEMLRQLSHSMEGLYTHDVTELHHERYR